MYILYVITFSEQLVILINHGLGDRLVVMATDSALSSVGEGESHDDNYIEWRDYTTDEYHSGFRLYLEHKKVFTIVRRLFKCIFS